MGSIWKMTITNRYTLEKGKFRAKVTEYELPESKKKEIFSNIRISGSLLSV